jgi:hypothetical protein
MEFDRSKILTAVTADQAKVGMKGWFGDSIWFLEKKVTVDPPSELTEIFAEDCIFRFKKAETGTTWTLFYPAQEPTYRPFNDEELNNLVGKVIKTKLTGCRKMVTGKPSGADGINLEWKYVSAKDLLYSYLMDDGTHCGVKE